MGLFFRKSFKAGPVKINLSKSGVGVSAGPKGLKAGVGPKGAYVSGGKGPVRYRKYINTKNKRSSNLTNKSKTYYVDEQIPLSEEIFIDTRITFPKTLKESQLLLGDIPKAPSKIDKINRYYSIGGVSLLLSIGSPLFILPGLASLFYGYLKNKNVDELNNLVLVAQKNQEDLSEAIKNNELDIDKHLNPKISNSDNKELAKFYNFVSMHSLFLGYFHDLVTKNQIIKASRILNIDNNLFNNTKEKVFKDVFNFYVSDFKLDKQEETKLKSFIDTFNLDKNSLKEDLNTIKKMSTFRKEIDSDLEKIEVDINLKNEECFYKTKSKIIKEKILKRRTVNGNKIKEIGYVENRSGTSYVTNKRILTVGSGSYSVKLDKILDIIVTPKDNVLEITVDNRKNPIIFTTPKIELFAAKIQKTINKYM